MTNLEKYNKILKRNLQATDEDLNETLDITSFSTYSKGIEILEKLGVDMSK